MYADHASTSYPTLFPPQGLAWGNPASGHCLGREARRAVDDARRRMALALGLPAASAPNILVTSGGTESDNLVLQQPRWRFIVTMATAAGRFSVKTPGAPRSTTPSIWRRSTWRPSAWTSSI